MKNRPKEISNHKEFINLLNDNGLTQLVTKPTRLHNTLDLMITNNPTRVNRTEILPGISDHEIVLCELDIIPATNKLIKRSIPLYRKADWKLLSDHIKNIEIKILNSPNSSIRGVHLEYFQNDLKNGVNKCIPHKTASNKANLPWITSEIKHLMRKRDRVYKSKLKTGSEHYNNIFKTLKAEIQRKLRRSYWDYIQGLITLQMQRTQEANLHYPHVSTLI